MTTPSGFSSSLKGLNGESNTTKTGDQASRSRISFRSNEGREVLSPKQLEALWKRHHTSTTSSGQCAILAPYPYLARSGQLNAQKIDDSVSHKAEDQKIHHSRICKNTGTPSSPGSPIGMGQARKKRNRRLKPGDHRPDSLSGNRHPHDRPSRRR